MSTKKVKSKQYKILAIIAVVVVCLSLVFAMVFLNVKSKTDYVKTSFSEKDFPLEIDLVNTVFRVGDKISFKATITNNYGEDVHIATNGMQPFVLLLRSTADMDDRCDYGQTSDPLTHEILKAGNKISKTFEQEIKEPGTYILQVRYSMEAYDDNDVSDCYVAGERVVTIIQNALEDITIHVK
ncbi:MAG: hypothetical protein FWE56_05990 [Candidatus Bathyarchaeota archaeon]|nr:hypothetical protein [Candidatus Termiticorpusculum sp.]MCL2868437.1 hypothetical protein [Candidatus Termiticorpusculum sp.]